MSVNPGMTTSGRPSYSRSNGVIVMPVAHHLELVPAKPQLLKKLKLQAFFIVLSLFNFLYGLFFFWSIRYLMLRLTGSSVGTKTNIQKVKFFTFGKLKVGSNTIINSGCYLDARRGITIGNHVVLAHNTKIYTLGHDFNDRTFATKGKSVVIEDYAIVFSNVLIMPGVTIGKGAVVLPGSVITKNVESMAVVGGNPAKIIKRREVLHTRKEAFSYWFST
jgi:acetyltransferase-like isoleucine patch superfamily enzyme